MCLLGWSYRVPNAILTLAFCMMAVFKMNPFILHLIVRHTRQFNWCSYCVFLLLSICLLGLFVHGLLYLCNMGISFGIIWKIYTLSSALLFLFFDIYSAWGCYNSLKHIEREIPVKPWYLSSTNPSFFFIEHVLNTRLYTA